MAFFDGALGDRRETLRAVVAATYLAALVALVGTQLAVGVSRPSLPLVLLFAGLVAASENASLRLPTPVNVSTQLLLVMCAVVAFRGDGAMIGAALVGAAGGLAYDSLKRKTWAALACNVGMMGLAAAGAAATYDALRTSVLGSWATYPLTVATYMVVNAALLYFFVRAKSDISPRAFVTEVRSSVLADMVVGIFGLVLGRMYLKDSGMALLLLVCVALVAHLMFRTIVQMRDVHNRLELIYGFTKRLGRSQEEAEAIVSILRELRGVMNAGVAELTTISGDHWRRTTLQGVDPRPVVVEGVGTPPEIEAAGSGFVSLADHPDRPDYQALTPRLGADGMVAPMRTEGALLGTLGIGHTEDGRLYGADDLRLLEGLAGHAAVTLENSQLLSKLRFDSHHDGLTGLPNRTRFNELLADLPRPSAVLLIDLDRFKEVNDTLGHSHGDMLLVSVAARVAEEVGHRGIVARLGGDEFAVLLPHTASSDAAQMALSLLAALEQPFAVGDLNLEVTASIGVAVTQDPATDADKLLQRADVAMYAAKESRSGWELYSSERDHYSVRRLALAGELRRAIEQGELEVHYQPKTSLRTGAIEGMEALVRWRHSRYGVLGPDQFIPVAESAGLIRPLTFFVLTEAVKFQQHLGRRGHDLVVAVNLSVRSVLDVNLPDQIAKILSQYQVSASSLTLEITESSVMADPSRTIGVLTRLANLGTSISVDDFGTGYSSLSYLKRLPATEVKIDRSFVAGMLNNESDLAIVRSTVDLARNLGLQAVAEGVEDRPTWDALAELGCDQAQGYYISAPMAGPQFEAWVRHNAAVFEPRP